MGFFIACADPSYLSKERERKGRERFDAVARGEDVQMHIVHDIIRPAPLQSHAHPHTHMCNPLSSNCSSSCGKMLAPNPHILIRSGEVMSLSHYFWMRRASGTKKSLVSGTSEHHMYGFYLINGAPSGHDMPTGRVPLPESASQTQNSNLLLAVCLGIIETILSSPIRR